MIASVPAWLKFVLLQIAYLAGNVMVIINPFVYIGFSSELRKKANKFYFGNTSEAANGQNVARGTPFLPKTVRRSPRIQPTPESVRMGRTAKEVKERGRRSARGEEFGETIC